MPRVLRATNIQRLRSQDPHDTTHLYLKATHVHFFFVEYHVRDDGIWEEERAASATVSVEELANLLDEAELLREIAPSNQSGGSTHEREP